MGDFKCQGDCLTCRAINDRRQQWQYCAAQFTYNSLRLLETMQGEIAELNKKIEAIQNSEAEVYDPTGGNSEIPI